MNNTEEFNRCFLEDINSHNLLEINEKQISLTERYIEPISDSILELIGLIRKKCDAKAIKEINTLDKKSEIYKHWSKYPEGFCLEIRDYVLQILEGEIKSKYKRYEPINSIRQFIKHGGILKQVWGIKNNEYFHNGIQLGHYFLDVANDTVDVTKSKTELSLLTHSGFKNINNIEEFGDIVELYWDRKVYPNIYFPRLAPFCPIITIDKNGQLNILDLCVALFSSNILNSFELAYDLIFNSKYSGRILPKECLSEISKKFVYNKKGWDYKNNKFICDSFNNTGDLEEVKNCFDFLREILNMEDKYVISSFIPDEIKVRDNFNYANIKIIKKEDYILYSEK